MDINRILVFADETELTTYNTDNGADLALENRIGFATSEETYWLMKGTDGLTDITGEDFNNYTEIIYGTIETRNINVTEFSSIKLGQYLYMDSDILKDTIGDWRINADVNGMYFQVCTVGDNTKGAGTWVTRQTITTLP